MLNSWGVAAATVSPRADDGRKAERVLMEEDVDVNEADLQAAIDRFTDKEEETQPDAQDKKQDKDNDESAPASDDGGAGNRTGEPVMMMRRPSARRWCKEEHSDPKG